VEGTSTSRSPSCGLANAPDEYTVERDGAFYERRKMFVEG
jgi:hypothetical protein